MAPEKHTITLDILICTIDEGIEKVPAVLMPPMGGVGYVVSMQYTATEKKELVPQTLREREDVEVVFLEGKGLSRNRNHALEHAKGEVVVIADDDNRYEERFIRNIVETYEEHPEADVICFAAECYEGKPMKTYPKDEMTFKEAFQQGYYPTSMEMTMRREVKTRFDERFGLGSKRLCAGEEDVFLKDALDKGYQVLFVPKVIVRSRFETTGSHFIGNPKLQRSKGATFKYLFGTPEAVWRTVKEAGWWLVHRGANPFPILLNMLKGMVEI